MADDTCPIRLIATSQSRYAWVSWLGIYWTTYIYYTQCESGTYVLLPLCFCRCVSGTDHGEDVWAERRHPGLCRRRLGAAGRTERAHRTLQLPGGVPLPRRRLPRSVSLSLRWETTPPPPPSERHSSPGLSRTPTVPVQMSVTDWKWQNQQPVKWRQWI